MTRTAPPPLVAILFVACGGAPQAYPLVEGGICPSREPDTCASDAEIFVCIEREWVVEDCEDVCAALGSDWRDDGCIVGEGEDACACIPPEGVCDLEESLCMDAESIAYCEAGAWSTAVCDDVCAELQPPRLSEGCLAEIGGMAWCSCTLAGAPCLASNAECDGPTTLAVCDEGIWRIDDCSEICGNGQATCANSACQC